ncbi:MAG: DMT family transporter [Hyphomicrobiaceae bacterium]
MSTTPVVAPGMNRNLAGIIYVVIGILSFSVQDVIIKFLSGDYAIHQIVLIRSFVSLPVLLVLASWQGGRRAFVGNRLGVLTVRSVLLYVAYTCYYLAIAAMPIADAMAIAFIAPLIVTALSKPLLGIQVDTRRWLAIAAGFTGTLVMLRPGFGVFEPAGLFAIGSASCYALSSILTRKLAATESSATMSLHAMVIYVVFSGLTGILIGDGHLAASTHPSMAFLLRAWSWPSLNDWVLVLTTGCVATVGMLCLAQAYRLGDPPIVAPFEYSGMIWALTSGFIFWHRVPDAIALIGMSIIVAAGLYIASLEGLRRPVAEGGGQP